ncbi:MAG: hypothetical protein ABIY37_07070 [Devosia sp.]
MTPARWTFVVIFGLSLLMGLAIGITELVAPNVSTVTLNGQDVTGMTGFWTALISGAVPGLIFGLIVAGIVALFTRRKKASV